MHKTVNVTLFTEIDGKRIELCEEDARALRDKLDAMLGDKMQWYPYPYRYTICPIPCSPEIPWRQPQVTYIEMGGTQGIFLS